MEALHSQTRFAPKLRSAPVANVTVLRRAVFTMSARVAWNDGQFHSKEISAVLVVFEIGVDASDLGPPVLC